MAISDKIAQLSDVLTNVYNTLAIKGATIPANKNFNNLNNTIASVPGEEPWNIAGAKKVTALASEAIPAKSIIALDVKNAVKQEQSNQPIFNAGSSHYFIAPGYGSSPRQYQMPSLLHQKDNQFYLYEATFGYTSGETTYKYISYADTTYDASTNNWTLVKSNRYNAGVMAAEYGFHILEPEIKRMWYLRAVNGGQYLRFHKVCPDNTIKIRSITLHGSAAHSGFNGVFDETNQIMYGLCYSKYLVYTITNFESSTNTGNIGLTKITEVNLDNTCRPVSDGFDKIFHMELPDANNRLKFYTLNSIKTLNAAATKIAEMDIQVVATYADVNGKAAGLRSFQKLDNGTIFVSYILSDNGTDIEKVYYGTLVGSTVYPMGEMGYRKPNANAYDYYHDYISNVDKDASGNYYFVMTRLNSLGFREWKLMKIDFTNNKAIYISKTQSLNPIWMGDNGNDYKGGCFTQPLCIINDLAHFWDFDSGNATANRYQTRIVFDLNGVYSAKVATDVAVHTGINQNAIAANTTGEVWMLP